jgi:site-specific DNA-methyltransferase (adenine-specific)
MGKEWDRLSDQPGYVERGRITDRPNALDKYSTSVRGVNSYQAGKPMQEWHERWAREALRVLKPGGYLLAFGGTRTYHRLACAVEDAGFEIRDRILVQGVEVVHPVELDWLYGSGFPKSLDVAKAIDKAAGAEREVVDRVPARMPQAQAGGWGNPGVDNFRDARRGTVEMDVTVPATDDALRWQGWGTALKPAHEPILVARKPLGERNVAANVLAHGTGALNIDGCRVEGAVPTTTQGQSSRQGEVYGKDQRDRREFVSNDAGRWPANVVLVHADGCERVGTREIDGDAHHPARRSGMGYHGGDGTEGGEREYGPGRVETVEAWECAPDCPVRLLDEQTGERRSAYPGRPDLAVEKVGRPTRENGVTSIPANTTGLSFSDSGGASRFFYCAKASRSEREAGLLGKVPCARCGGLDTTEHEIDGKTGKCIRNDHPTVKPVGVMRWLVRLVSPSGGAVLDPFAGSGTTGMACEYEGFGFVGFENDERSAQIADARIGWARLDAERERAEADAVRRERERRGAQMDLLSDGAPS